MSRYPDAYAAMTPCALWHLIQAGWTGAIPALVDRFDATPPPVPGLDPTLPAAARWAELLTRPSCPFCRDVPCQPLALEEVIL